MLSLRASVKNKNAMHSHLRTIPLRHRWQRGWAPAAERLAHPAERLGASGRGGRRLSAPRGRVGPYPMNGWGAFGGRMKAHRRGHPVEGSARMRQEAAAAGGGGVPSGMAWAVAGGEGRTGGNGWGASGGRVGSARKGEVRPWVMDARAWVGKCPVAGWAGDGDHARQISGSRAAGAQEMAWLGKKRGMPGMGTAAGARRQGKGERVEGGMRAGTKRGVNERLIRTLFVLYSLPRPPVASLHAQAARKAVATIQGEESDE